MSLPIEIKAFGDNKSFEAASSQLCRKIGSALNNHELVTDRFETVQKKGFKWVILSLFRTLARPFYALLGKDPYSYVRIENVARSIFNFCELNKQHMDSKQEKRINALLGALNLKTKHKYDKTITDIQSKVHQYTVNNLLVKQSQLIQKGKPDQKEVLLAKQTEILNQIKDGNLSIEQMFAMQMQMNELHKLFEETTKLINPANEVIKFWDYSTKPYLNIEV